MIIDAHVHPVLFGCICQDKERVSFRKQQFGLYKSSPIPMEQVMAVMDHACVDKAVIFGLDYSCAMGDTIVSNEEIRQIMDQEPGRFVGFASVDPRDPEAPAKLRSAFADLELCGLKLNLAHVQMDPSDPRLDPLFEICLEYNKPVTFECGFCWEPDSPSKYLRPILYEDVAVKYPGLRFCLSHLGWPWTDELCMLLLKYPNIYTDTATIYMDSPKNWFDQIFMKNMAPGWLQNNLMDKVMYGSSLPRFRQVRVMDGIRKLGLRMDVEKKILGDNAKVFLGMEVRGYDY